MNKYSGIDLHANNCVVVVSDEEDHICCERRLPNDLAKILALLEPFRGDLVAVAVESTFNWYWLVDGLRGHWGQFRHLFVRLPELTPISG